MKRIGVTRDDIAETNNWMPISYLTLGFVMIVLVFLASGLTYYKSELASKTQKVDTNLSNEVSPGADAKQLKLLEDELAAQKAKITELAGLRMSIAKELKGKLTALIINADIDETTGNVRLKEAMLFNVNKADVSDAGKEYLKKLIPAYFSVIMNDKNKKYIEQIVVEGHADDGGTFLYNLELSQKRSYSVVEYIITNKLAVLSDGTNIEKNISINGKSFSNPVLVNGVADKNQSRRVELVFRLKYDEMLDKMQKAFKGGEK